MVALDAESRQWPTSTGPGAFDSGSRDGAPWREHHRLLALADDGSAALALQIGAHPGRALASFACVVFRIDQDPIVISEADIELPADLWEFRASGLWADQICERPLVHWSYGLEAFALAIDSPSELLGQAYGQRVPLGWELDFEGAPDMVAELPTGEGAELCSYGQPGRIEGLVLFGDGTMTLAGPALRHHWWGNERRDPDATLAWSGPGNNPGSKAPVSVALPLPNGVWWVTCGDDGLRSRWEVEAVQG